ncbi:MAG: hypothetical protein DRR42_10675 [Gammaproteobacteria bacterium]|nr:MAG: hypothetical protein DRR42_10675 [Gammaproteobacteria bacterium]
MNIGNHLRELDIVKNAAPLISAVLQLSEDTWLQDQSRQTNYHVHSQTQSLVLLFCEGEWPDMQVEKRSAWDHLGNQAIPVMREILDRHYNRGGVILRAMAAKLIPHGTIEQHTDNHPSFACAHRIHVPIITNPDAIFLVGGKQVTMDVGKGYEINNQMPHRVHNGGDTDRIHFIFDYLPPDNIEKMPEGLN